jgi:hypothetical protein
VSGLIKPSRGAYVGPAGAEEGGGPRSAIRAYVLSELVEKGSFVLRE